MKFYQDTLVPVFCPYKIIFGQKAFEKFLRKRGTQVNMCPQGDSEACTWRLAATDKAPRQIVVVMHLDCRKCTVTVLSLIVHEAVHVWKAQAECMAEETPSEELEAYAIQGISHNLIQGYHDWLAKRKAKKDAKKASKEA